MKRIVALFLVIVCVCATSTVLAARDAPIGYYIRFLPTLITVSKDYVKVTGYFVNLNDDVEVKNFREFEMTLYQNGKQICKGNFGTINQFTVPPLDMYKQSFTFKGKFNNLKVGTFSCDESYSSAFSCKFSYSER